MDKCSKLILSAIVVVLLIGQYMQQGSAAPSVEEQTHHNDEAVQVQVADNEHDAEIELSKFRRQILDMGSSLYIKNQHTRAIRQCDDMIPAMERYISGHHDAEQTTWRREHLSTMERSLELVIFYKAMALKMSGRCAEAQEVTDDLVRRQSADGRTPLEETLELKNVLRSCV